MEMRRFYPPGAAGGGFKVGFAAYIGGIWRIFKDFCPGGASGIGRRRIFLKKVCKGGFLSLTPMGAII